MDIQCILIFITWLHIIMLCSSLLTNREDAWRQGNGDVVLLYIEQKLYFLLTNFIHLYVYLVRAMWT